MYIRQIRRALLDDLDLPLLGLPGTQTYGIGGQPRGVDPLSIARALAQEGAHALDHLGCVLGMSADAFQPLSEPLPGLPFRLQSVEIPLTGTGVIDDRRQWLVDFVGDARGQLTQGGEAGGVAELVLQATVAFFAADAFGDVPRHADHFHHAAGIGLPNRAAGGLEPQVMTVPRADLIAHAQTAIPL